MRKRKLKFDEKTIQEWVKYYTAEKRSCNGIAKLYNCSQTTVHRHLKKLGVKTRSSKDPCYSAYRRQRTSETMTGSGNPNWKGGFNYNYKENWEHSLKHREWRKKVYKRDKYTCQVCFQKPPKVKINAHHIAPFIEFLNLRYNTDNGITLCEKCHKEIHRRMRKSSTWKRISKIVRG